VRASLIIALLLLFVLALLTPLPGQLAQSVQHHQQRARAQVRLVHGGLLRLLVLFVIVVGLFGPESVV